MKCALKLLNTQKYNELGILDKKYFASVFIE